MLWQIQGHFCEQQARCSTSSVCMHAYVLLGAGEAIFSMSRVFTTQNQHIGLFCAIYSEQDLVSIRNTCVEYRYGYLEKHRCVPADQNKIYGY
jgi:hypothetical protein